jgi:ubiquitin-protein ligase
MKASKRQIKDFKELQSAGPKSGIYLKDVSAELDKPPFTELRMMLIGPEGPYKNCLFFFRIFFTERYPFKPPKVKFLCPYSIRCHPNLYRYAAGQPDSAIGNGKCCLSILGTWAGPPWTPMMSLETIAQTILMILDDEPLRNEPGYVKSGMDKIQPYTDYVRWVCLKESIPLWTGELPEMYAMFTDVIKELLNGTENVGSMRDELVDQLIKLSEEFDGNPIKAVIYGNKTDNGKEYNYTGLLDSLM